MQTVKEIIFCIAENIAMAILGLAIIVLTLVALVAVVSLVSYLIQLSFGQAILILLSGTAVLYCGHAIGKITLRD